MENPFDTLDGLRVSFEPGSGLLCQSSSRLLYLAGGLPLHSALEDVFRATDPASFFRSAVAAWMSSSNQGDLLAVVMGASVTVVAGGQKRWVVETTDQSRVVDPSGNSFVTEQTVEGSLVRLELGDGIGLASPYWAKEGVFSVGRFVVEFSSEITKRVSNRVAHELRIPAETALKVAEETWTGLSTSETRPLEPATSEAALPVSTEPFEDGLTVWPHLGKTLVPPADEVFETTLPVNTERAAPETPVSVPTERPLEPIPARSIEMVESADTLMWGNTVAGEVSEGDDAEMTMHASDLAKYRVAPVRIVENVPVGGGREQVVGAHCTSGHFTDSRKVLCLFCASEVEFDRFGPGDRPILGVIEFDDGRVIDLTKGVVVGRKPTLRSAEDAHLVSFEGDMMLSRIHTEIKLVDWDVVVIDRQSANGTTIVHVDGRSIASRPNMETAIDDGCVVKFGGHALTFRRNHE